MGVDGSFRDGRPLSFHEGDMGLSTVRHEYEQAVVDTDQDRALAVLRDAVEAGASPEVLVFEIVIPSLDAMCGSDRGQSSLAQHFMTSQIASRATELLVAQFETPAKAIGRVVIGTAQGDFHGLGARIVAGCLRASMIDVVDLGRDVPPERFVDAAVESGAGVICVSSMMLHTARGANGPAAVRRLLSERELERDIKIAVGGAPFRHDPGLWQAVGADTWAENGLAAGKVVNALLQGVRR
jgi:trimethylamine corrinoid protein